MKQLNRKVKAAANEIEITPEMIDRASMLVLSYSPEYEGPTEFAERLLRGVLRPETVTLHKIGEIPPDAGDFFRNLSNLFRAYGLVDDGQLAATCADAHSSRS